MQRTVLIITIVAGILAAPFLCDAGVTVHECHCDEFECCTDEGSACEPDRCDDVYKDNRQKNDPVDDPSAVVALSGVVLPAAVAPAAADDDDPGGNLPFDDGDLPLRV